MDLRSDINELFDGDGIINGFSFTIILRSVDKTQHSPSYDPLKEEAKENIWLTYDRFVKTVKRKYVGKEDQTEVGKLTTDSTLFFFKHDMTIGEQDQIIEIVTDDLGNPVSPIKYIKKYSIKDVEVVRGNHGRVEFIQVYASEAE
jgi:hypothetical protein